MCSSDLPPNLPPDGCPVIQCPADLTVTGCSDTAVVNFTVTASNPCHPSDVPKVVCTPASGSQFPVGTTTVNCVATDATGASVSCQFRVTVRRDTSPPQIKCPADIAANAPTLAGVPVSFAVTAVDDTDPNPSIVCVPPSGSVFAPGTTTVQCTATDRCGNVSACSFKVTVRSDACLRIECPADLTVVTCSNTAVVSYVPVALNVCSPTPPFVVCIPVSGSSFPLGDRKSTRLNSSH